MPAPRAQAHVEIAGTAAGFRHAYARIGGEHVWKKNRPAPNEPTVDAYTLVNVGVGGETRWSGRPLRLDLGIKNALNESYRDFLNRYRDFALNPGRDITLRVSVDL